MSRFYIIALAASMLSSTPALAQETGVSGQLERSSSTSPQEKLQYAASSNAEMREAVKSVSKLLEAARRESNVERLQCLTNRLTAIRALVQVSEAAEVAMKDALNTGQAERADHEFRKIAVALTKTRQLLAEAERCMDDSGLKSGDTILQVEGGVTDEGDDTADVPVDVLDLGYDPPEASPFN
jgi:hypothetical protein